MPALLRVNERVVVFGFDPDDFRGLEYNRSIAVLEGKSLKIGLIPGRRAGVLLVVELGRQGCDLRRQLTEPSLSNAALRAIESFLESLVREWLEHIVGGADIERLRGVVTERCDEHHNRALVRQMIGEL